MSTVPFAKLKIVISSIVNDPREVPMWTDDAMQPIPLDAMDDAQVVAEICSRVRLPDFSVYLPIDHPEAKVFLNIEAEHNESGFVATDLNIVVNNVMYSDVDYDWLEDPTWAAAMHVIWDRVLRGLEQPVEGTAFVDLLRGRVENLINNLKQAGLFKGVA